MIIDSLHILSPLLYALFVSKLKTIKPCPDNYFMKLARYHHNIFLSVLSFLMLIGITIGNYQTNKLSSINNILCKSYDNNYYSTISSQLFLYSKYIEWGDTMFLHLSGKKISMLQYTHHMTTALLMYLNTSYYLSPHIFVFMSLNCIIHVIMYLYFAYPNGFLSKYKKIITQSQIIQHIICLSTIFYTTILDNCKQNPYGNESGFILYSMYLFYFSLFYLKSYIVNYCNNIKKCN